MSTVIYTKYSNERASRFSIRTDIMAENGRRMVRKCAMNTDGQDHVEKLERWYQELTKIYWKSGLSLNRCHYEQGELRLEYLEGETLEEYLDSCLSRGDTRQVEDYLFEYLEQVKQGFILDSFTMTDSFREVFGDVELSEDLLSGNPVNIDMVLNNVILNQGKTLIDYEWTFDFPIPYHYVAYRIIYYYLRGNTTRSALSEDAFMEKAGITPGECEIYEKMERHFQDVYLVSEGDGDHIHVPLRDMYEEITPGEISLRGYRMAETQKNANAMVQIYQAKDLEFQEEQSEIKMCYKPGIFLDSVPVNEDSRYVRLDPASRYCIVRKLQMHWGQEITQYKTNGIVQKDGSIFFPMDDPQIIVSRPVDCTEPFRAYFEIEYLDEQEALEQTYRQWMQLKRENMELETQNRHKEDVIHQMENTRVWKAYRKIRKK